jgi:hypothetical protein
MVRSPYYLDKKLNILKDFCSITSMNISTNKMKVMIINSNKITYHNFMYEKNTLEEVFSYKYLAIDLHHKLNWNYSIEKKDKWRVESLLWN